LRLVLLTAGAIGVVFYFGICVIKKYRVEFSKIVTAVFGAAGIVGGIHLAVCAFLPQHLVIVQKGGVPFQQEGLEIDMGEWHAIEILAAGVALSALSFSLFLSALRKPE